MTLHELCIIIFVLAGGTVGADLLGDQVGLIGYPIGFVAGVVLLIWIIWFLMYFDEMRSVGRPRFPSCRKGKCNEYDYDYEYQMENGHVVYLYRCKCGDQYEKRGKHFYFVNIDGVRKPYLIWHSFDGWYTEDE